MKHNDSAAVLCRCYGQINRKKGAVFAYKPLFALSCVAIFLSFVDRALFNGVCAIVVFVVVKKKMLVFA